MVVGVLMVMRKSSGSSPDSLDAGLVMSVGALGIRLVAPDLELSYKREE